jgi:hypothetical protein
MGGTFLNEKTPAPLGLKAEDAGVIGAGPSGNGPFFWLDIGSPSVKSAHSDRGLGGYERPVPNYVSGEKFGSVDLSIFTPP